jgi:hypothetical protein
MFIIRRCKLIFWLIIDQIKVTTQLIHGVWHIARLPKPIVTIFGGARLPQSSPYAAQARDLAQKLSEHNISVLTGGGPGAMEAAGCGVIKSKELRSLGIGVEGLIEGSSLCVQHYINTKYFFVRKWLLMRYSSGFVAFPGGFGTVDEIAEVATLIQTRKMPCMPIILIGKIYWQPFITWLIDSALKEGLISQDDLQLLMVTDNINHAYSLLHKHCFVEE